MCHQLEMHAACQAVCDALMGMIFGVWGSKHEPRPIRERDVLDIKGNKESWLRYRFPLSVLLVLKKADRSRCILRVSLYHTRERGPGIGY